VERAAWTDERLDDRMSAIDTSFERVFEEMRAERAEVRAEIRGLRAEIHDLRAEMHARFAETREDTLALHRQVTQILTGLTMALIGALAAAIVAAF
jgi:predicted  nucleic acid-binding Zn-ribbon protein